MTVKQNGLPIELTTLVRIALQELGNAIAANYGNDVFDMIENVRSTLKPTKDQDDASKYTNIKQVDSLLQKKSTAYLNKIARCFAVYMETINRCETAYRHFRLEQNPQPADSNDVNRITFVFTAHPTEARSVQSIETFKALEDALIEILRLDFRDEVICRKNLAILF